MRAAVTFWLAAAHPAGAEVALVLGGGGAAGTAHVGVIAELERQGLRPDCIVGTSMGALVGGLYAAGYGGPELERIAREIDWDGVLARSVARADLHPIRKESRLDRFDSQSRLPVGIGEEGPTVSGGLLDDVRLGLILRDLTEPVAGVGDFDRLPIPFRAVAADLETGDPVVLGSGDLATALRASMSIPGLFAPVERDGRLLVDGGIADNLPIERGRALCGPDVIVSFIPPTDPDPRNLRSLTGALGQTLSLFIHRRSREQIGSMAPGDVLIRPPVEAIGMLDFGATEAAIAAGREAAAAQQAAIRRLVRGRAPLAPLTPGPLVNLDYDRLVVENASRTDERVIRARLGLAESGSIPAAELQERLLALYGLDVFSSVTYATRAEDGETLLVVRTTGRDTGQLEFRAGLSLSGDSQGQGNLSLLFGGSYVGLNTLGGRLDVDGAVGATDAARLRFEQPLDYGQTWFLRPSVSFLGQDTFARLPSSGSRGEFRVRQVEVPVELLWAPGDWGRIGLGAGFAAQKVTLETGAQDAAARAGLDEGWESRPLIGPVFDYDTLDDVDLPLSGEQVAARVLVDPTGPGDGNFGWGLVDVSGVVARTAGRNTYSVFGLLRGELEPAGLSPSFLGGFQRLSGYDNFGIAGNVAALGGLRVYRRFDIDLPVAQLGFLGSSLEIGGVYSDWGDVAWPGTEIHGSLFGGVVTPLGPLIMAGGLGEGGEFALHLTLGQRF